MDAFSFQKVPKKRIGILVDLFVWKKTCKYTKFCIIIWLKNPLKLKY